ncbi:MAG: copper-binding protein [Longimicrobiales bacterium]
MGDRRPRDGEELGWPAMTMSFAVPDASLLERFTRGREVVFEFVERSGATR